MSFVRYVWLFFVALVACGKTELTEVSASCSANSASGLTTVNMLASETITMSVNCLPVAGMTGVALTASPDAGSSPTTGITGSLSSSSISLLSSSSIGSPPGSTTLTLTSNSAPTSGNFEVCATPTGVASGYTAKQSCSIVAVTIQ